MCHARARRAPRPRFTLGSAQRLNLTPEPLDHLRLDTVERLVERLALWRALWRASRRGGVLVGVLEVGDQPNGSVGVLVGVLEVGDQPNGSVGAPLCGNRWAGDPIANTIGALVKRRRVG